MYVYRVNFVDFGVNIVLVLFIILGKRVINKIVGIN